MYRIVLDTNVLVSGLRSRLGASFQILNRLPGREFQVVLTVPLVVEYEKSLLNPRVGITLRQQDILVFLDYVCQISEHQIVHYLWRPFLRDPKDDMVLEAAVNGSCSHLVTHNVKDFQGAGGFAVTVITPKKFLSLIGERL